MEKYIESLKKKQVIASRICLASIIFLIAIIITDVLIEGTISSRTGINFYFFASYGIGGSIGYWSKCQTKLEDSEKFKKHYHEDTDERLVFIKRKADETTASIVFYALLFVSVVLAPFHFTISLTAFSVATFGMVITFLFRKFFEYKM